MSVHSWHAQHLLVTCHSREFAVKGQRERERRGGTWTLTAWASEWAQLVFNELKPWIDNHSLPKNPKGHHVTQCFCHAELAVQLKMLMSHYRPSSWHLICLSRQRTSTAWQQQYRHTGRHTRTAQEGNDRTDRQVCRQTRAAQADSECLYTFIDTVHYITLQYVLISSPNLHELQCSYSWII